MPSAATESVFSVPLNHFRNSGVASLGCAEESAEHLNLPMELANNSAEGKFKGELLFDAEVHTGPVGDTI